MKIIRHNWHHLRNDPTVGRFFPQYPIMAFKKNANLKRFLVRARIRSEDHSITDNIQLDLDHNPILDFPKIDIMNPPKNVIDFVRSGTAFYINISLSH